MEEEALLSQEFLKIGVGWLTKVGVALCFPPIKSFIYYICIFQLQEN